MTATSLFEDDTCNHREQSLMCRHVWTWTWVLFPYFPLPKASHLAMLRLKGARPNSTSCSVRMAITIGRYVYVKIAGITVAISADNLPQFALWPQSKFSSHLQNAFSLFSQNSISLWYQAWSIGSSSNQVLTQIKIFRFSSSDMAPFYPKISTLKVPIYFTHTHTHTHTHTM